eukprot:TRINITY_DN1184_c0_g1_i1.p1 TRINITY_DN1184_c0_g1~~TRINITY_DN1184_c0_g1_i1.p1  ORF type:complete len:150 (+),score=54.10 TRINITY_DN1184_c0_g1_i1:69-452(+)
MKILTHNMLMCTMKKCSGKDNFPLRIVATEIDSTEAEPNFDFIGRLLSRIDYPALKEAATTLGVEGLPEEMPPTPEENEEFLRVLHHLLFEINVKEGELVCKNCGREFPVRNSIPNMCLREDEVEGH